MTAQSQSAHDCCSQWWELRPEPGWVSWCPATELHPCPEDSLNTLIDLVDVPHFPPTL